MSLDFQSSIYQQIGINTDLSWNSNCFNESSNTTALNTLNNNWIKSCNNVVNYTFDFSSFFFACVFFYMVSERLDLFTSIQGCWSNSCFSTYASFFSFIKVSVNNFFYLGILEIFSVKKCSPFCRPVDLCKNKYALEWCQLWCFSNFKLEFLHNHGQKLCFNVIPRLLNLQRTFEVTNHWFKQAQMRVDESGLPQCAIQRYIPR